MDEAVRLLPDRSGFTHRGEVISGFPFIPEMSQKARLRVARWASQLTPDSLTDEQRALLDAQPPRVPSEAQLEWRRQDEILSSPMVRTLWRELPEAEKSVVMNPDLVLGKRYPLSTGELAKLTGLTNRQIQYWSGDLDLLPCWVDHRGHRRFESPAAVIAFALRGLKQHERQFYADLGTEQEPLERAAETISLLGIRILAVLSEANPTSLDRTEAMLRTVADSIAQTRATKPHAVRTKTAKPYAVKTKARAPHVVRAAPTRKTSKTDTNALACAQEHAR